MQEKVIVVSNRLPLKVKKLNGEYVYTKTSGGLVTGLNSAKQSLDFLWMGTVEGVDKEDEEAVRTKCIDEFGYCPVFIDTETYNKYYNNMCNAVLWPILHSFSDLVQYRTEDYDAYKQVNTLFCTEILKLTKGGDMVWVHDYHLMLLPEMLRANTKDKLRIGYFLHIPFPHTSIICGFSLLYPIVKGILGADLVAFHTFEYVANFRSACALYETNTNPFCVKLGSSIARVEAIPIGIDPSMFMNESLKETTKERVAALRKQFGGKKVILGVDRVDYIKGIPHRLKAFMRLLKKRPHLADKVVFCQVGVPSRLDVGVYQILSDTLCKLSGSVNARGNIEDTNVYFINNSVTFTELCALYMLSDVCVVSSLRDGMNLVSLEFIACAGSGALVMSDYAGATGMLIGAIQANPWNIEELSQSYEEALSMPENDRIQRKMSMQKVISEFTATQWAIKFIKCLKG